MFVHANQLAKAIFGSSNRRYRVVIAERSAYAFYLHW